MGPINNFTRMDKSRKNLISLHFGAIASNGLWLKCRDALIRLQLAYSWRFRIENVSGLHIAKNLEQIRLICRRGVRGRHINRLLDSVTLGIDP